MKADLESCFMADCPKNKTGPERSDQNSLQYFVHSAELSEQQYTFDEHTLLAREIAFATSPVAPEYSS